jgi:SAM-dependent methyltransferase
VSVKVHFNRLLRITVERAFRSSLFPGIRTALKSMLLEGTIPITSVAKNRSFGVFKDSKGNIFPLIEGIRDAVKPGWQGVTRSLPREIPDPSKLKPVVRQAGETVRRMLSFLKLSGFEIKDKNVLEIGCSDGSKTFALLAGGSRKVIGSDISTYYLSASGNNAPAAPDIRDQQEYLDKLRKSVAKATFGDGFMPKGTERAEFVEDDISASSLPSDSFDLVCSWEVLEHVTAPQKLFSQLYRILKPGGIAFHEYNPFYSINGGHSHCTLDFLWGHVMLDEENFARYVREFRPNEAEGALNIFLHGLNRMTISDIRKYSHQSGLIVSSLIPWYEKSHLTLLAPEQFRIARRMYPSLTLEDLISPYVWVVLMKSPINNA